MPDQLIGAPVRDWAVDHEDCVAYGADLRRAHACLYPSVRRGRLSLPRLEAAPPIGLPWALRRARPARIRSERLTDSCVATHAATAASSSVVASVPLSQGLLMADERDVALAQLPN